MGSLSATRRRRDRVAAGLAAAEAHAARPAPPVTAPARPFGLAWMQTYLPHYLTCAPSRLHLDFAAELAGLHARRGTHLARIAPRGSAKCQPGTARVAMADGSVKLLREVRAGDRVVSVDDGLNVTTRPVLWAAPTGIKSIVRITTRGGAVARVSTVHRMMTFGGWAEAGGIAAGDFLAAPRRLPGGRGGDLTEAGAKVLAYWIAEGCRQKTSSVQFANVEPAIHDDAIAAAAELGWGASKKFDRRAGRVTGVLFTGRESKWQGWSLARRWMAGHGIDTTTCGAFDKFVPDAVFRASEPTRRVFLSRLFACDGTISSCSSRGRDTVTVGYTSVSRRLVEDVRSLLLQFGIVSRMGSTLAKCGDYSVTAYRLFIHDAANVRLFVSSVGMFTKDPKAAALVEGIRADATNGIAERVPPEWRGLRTTRGVVDMRAAHDIRVDNGYATTRAKVARVAEIEDNDALRRIVNADVWWDEVVSVEPDGEEETFDISVDGTENYVSDGLVSHNTTWMTTGYGLYCALEGVERYVLILSETGDQAKAFLRSIKDEVQSNAAVARDYPHAAGVGPTWEAMECRLRNGVLITARGAGGRIRGLKNRDARPSLVLVDDPNEKDDAYSPTLRQRKWDWFTRDVMAVGDIATTNVLVAGTPIHREAICYRLRDAPGWRSKTYKSVERFPDRADLWQQWERAVTNLADPDRTAAGLAFYAANRPAMDAGAEVLWAERESLYDLMLFRAANGDAAFNSEKQDEPGAGGAVEWPAAYFDDPKLWFDDWPADVVHKVYALDPSKGGESKAGDYQAHARIGVTRAGTICVECELRREDVAAMARRAVRGAADFGAAELVVEENGTMGFVVPEFERTMAELKLLVPLRGVTNTAAKDARIRRLGPYLSRAAVRVRNTAGGRDLVAQWRAFPTGDYDDGPDAVATGVIRLEAIVNGRA